MPRHTADALTPLSEAVSRRFFEAVERLVALRLVPSVDGFCRLHGLCAPRYREMRITYGNANSAGGRVSRYKNVQVAALSLLVSAYPVSARWLLTGRGQMLMPKQTPRQR